MPHEIANSNVHCMKPGLGHEKWIPNPPQTMGLFLLFSSTYTMSTPTTPPHFNIAPEKCWLEDKPFLLGPGNFSVAMPAKLREGKSIEQGHGAFQIPAANGTLPHRQKKQVALRPMIGIHNFDGKLFLKPNAYKNNYVFALQKQKSVIVRNMFFFQNYSIGYQTPLTHARLNIQACDIIVSTRASLEAS